MTNEGFAGSREAEEWFREELRKRRYQRIEETTFREYVKGGRYAYPKIYKCDNRDAYMLTFWRSRDDMLWDSSRVTDEFRALDQRLKLTLSIFGRGMVQMTQCKESTLLHLLELEANGFTSFMVTVYSNGSIYWSRVREFYEFATRYGTYQEVFKNAELAVGLPYRVPTGWMIPWEARSIRSAAPSI